MGVTPRNFPPKDFQGEASDKLYLSSASVASETLLAGVKPTLHARFLRRSSPFAPPGHGLSSSSGYLVCSMYIGREVGGKWSEVRGLSKTGELSPNSMYMMSLCGT